MILVSQWAVAAVGMESATDTPVASASRSLTPAPTCRPYRGPARCLLHRARAPCRLLCATRACAGGPDRRWDHTQPSWSSAVAMWSSWLSMWRWVQLRWPPALVWLPSARWDLWSLPEPAHRVSAGGGVRRLSTRSGTPGSRSPPPGGWIFGDGTPSWHGSRRSICPPFAGRNTQVGGTPRTRVPPRRVSDGRREAVPRRHRMPGDRRSRWAYPDSRRIRRPQG
jgi:hypothetical protein